MLSIFVKLKTILVGSKGSLLNTFFTIFLSIQLPIMSRKTSTLDRQSVKPSDTAYQLVWLLSFLPPFLSSFLCGSDGMGLEWGWIGGVMTRIKVGSREREARIMGGNMPPPWTHGRRPDTLDRRRRISRVVKSQVVIAPSQRITFHGLLIY